LPGPLNDHGFNDSGNSGLVRAEKDFGVEGSVSENTQPSAFDSTINDYGSRGFDIVIGLGFQFGDPFHKAAPKYPNTKFFVINNPLKGGPNLQGIDPKAKDGTYLAGNAAAKLSKTGRMTTIGGFNFPAIVAQMEGFRLGAIAANPKAIVHSVYVGSFTDAALGRETTDAEISAGSDFFMANADAVGVAMLKECEAKGVKAIGFPGDQSSVAPKAVVFSVVVDQGEMVYRAIESVVKGTFKGGATPLEYGLESPVVRLVDTENLPADLQASLKDLQAKIISGEIEVPFIGTPTTK
jgi:basic membrane protein A